MPMDTVSKHILSMKPPPPSWDPRTVKLGVIFQALQKRDAETPTYFLIPGYCTEATIQRAKRMGKKVEKIYENKGGWVGEPNWCLKGYC